MEGLLHRLSLGVRVSNNFHDDVNGEPSFGLAPAAGARRMFPEALVMWRWNQSYASNPILSSLLHV